MRAESYAAGPPVMAPEARAVAERLATDVPGLANSMFAYLTARIPEVDMDAEARALTLASCASNLEAALSMLRHGIPVTRAEPPVAALEHARHMAAHGVSINATLRFYRLGHAWFWDLWVDALGREIADGGRLAAVLQETSGFSFAYLDAISTAVSVELLAERDRRERRITAQREDLILRILAGETVDAARAERTLGFAFSALHLAFICWAEGDPADLERTAAAFAALLGTRRPLLVAHGGAEIAGWQRLDTDAPGAVPRAVAAAAELPPGARIAVGTAGLGVDGFRAGHEHARQAQRCARIAGPRAAAITSFEDIRFVDLLSRDLPAARAFVAAELGGLAAGDERSEVLRVSLRVLLEKEGDATATAAALGVHRNTVRQRLARAEDLRGRPVTQNGAELRAALALTDALGTAVLRDA